MYMSRLVDGCSITIPGFFIISGAKCMFMVRPRDMRSKTYSNVGSRVLVQCIHLAYLTDAHCQSPV